MKNQNRRFVWIKEDDARLAFVFVVRRGTVSIVWRLPLSSGRNAGSRRKERETKGKCSNVLRIVFSSLLRGADSTGKAPLELRRFRIGNERTKIPIDRSTNIPNFEYQSDVAATFCVVACRVALLTANKRTTRVGCPIERNRAWLCFL